MAHEADRSRVPTLTLSRHKSARSHFASRCSPISKTGQLMPRRVVVRPIAFPRLSLRGTSGTTPVRASPSLLLPLLPTHLVRATTGTR
jgi:hypothetical protein